MTPQANSTASLPSVSVLRVCSCLVCACDCDPVCADKARQLLAEITELKKKHKERMAEASAKAFQLHNPDCKVWDIDLHGQSVPKAMDRFVKQLNCLIDMEQPGGILFKVIVGQGHHSEDNVPKIKNQVGQWLLDGLRLGRMLLIWGTQTCLQPCVGIAQ